MTLGEALTTRRRQAERLNDLNGRITQNVMVQEGDSAQEDPSDLLQEFIELSLKHADLVRRIMFTNLSTGIGDGRTIHHLLTEREHLQRVRAVVHRTANEAAPKRDRFFGGRNEIKFVPTIVVADLRTMEENLSQEINDLDLRIQEINWKTELL